MVFPTKINKLSCKIL